MNNAHLNNMTRAHSFGELAQRCAELKAGCSSKYCAIFKVARSSVRMQDIAVMVQLKLLQDELCRGIAAFTALLSY